ncbi:MAG: sulfonate transporter substrate-binding protein [Blastococcus sp.]|jgi:NitT/TauT family transport system substrate-binding protein|nr:sulfonate transporter substrate-binding protein [Blastococcus sp.]
MTRSTTSVARMATVSVASLVLAACGSGSDTDSSGAPAGEQVEVRFSFEFTPTGYHAPYALAVEKGWFADAGLDVSLMPGTGSAATITTVAGGQADIGLADLATLVITKEEDLPVSAFGVMFPEAPTAVAVHEDLGVEGPADLAGMTIAVTTGGLDAQLLPAFLESNGLTGEVEAINVSSSAKTGAFLARQVDGFVPLLCGTGVVVEQQEGAPLTALPFSEYGVDIMGLGFITSDSFMEEHPETLTTFLKVAGRAWEYAQEHVEEAVEAMTTQFPEIEPETAQAQVECAFDFIASSEDPDAAFGTMSDAKWDAMLGTLEQYADVQPLNPREYYTTQYAAE